ncbi:MAG: hypothetical protein CI953_29 [Methanohalophilus sp.]|jgi:hypothetical protein|nr:MAG: hypothetical protein CI953_29 [Methanohalophilus sp.]
MCTLKIQPYVILNIQLPKSDKHILKTEIRLSPVPNSLLDNIGIYINGALICKNLFRTAIFMAADNGSFYSILKHYQETTCETSIRYHLKILDIDELIGLNENILLQKAFSILKRGKKYEFAIYFTNDPCYGESGKPNENYVIHI